MGLDSSWRAVGRTRTHSELFLRTWGVDGSVPQRCPWGQRTENSPTHQGPWSLGRERTGAWGPLLSHATPGASGATPLLRPSTLLPNGFSREDIFKAPSSKVYTGLACLLESDVFLKVYT